MENCLNRCDREYLKMAMLKHEETFREQVYELHRLYHIQKTLMKDVVKTRRRDTACRWQCNDPPESGDKCRVSEMEDDRSDYNLELTLGPGSYYQKKIKASEPSRLLSDNSGLSFSSSSTGSSHVKGATTGSLSGEKLLSWGVTKQDQSLNSPPWLFQALSLNMT